MTFFTSSSPASAFISPSPVLTSASSPLHLHLSSRSRRLLHTKHPSINVHKTKMPHRYVSMLDSKQSPSSSKNSKSPQPNNNINNDNNTNNDNNDIETTQQQQKISLSPIAIWNLIRHSPERFRIVFLSFLSFVICNCDRINISVAILPMAKYYHWNQTTVGLVQSAFFWGYVLTQIPGGYFADKFGGKQVLAFGVVIWSAMTMLTPLAAASPSITVLLVARALLGFGEGVAMPAVNNIISKWVPERERARSLSLIYSGMYLGSVVGLSLCPPLIISFGWQSVFYIFGSLGFFWWIVWQFSAASSPQLSDTIQPDELRYILKYTQGINEEDNEPQQQISKKSSFNESVGVTGSIPWKDLLTKSPTWAIIIAHFCTTWGYFVLLTWLPTYFNQQLGFDLAASSFLSIVPWLAMFISANVGGSIADSLRARGVSTTTVRKLMQSIGLMGPAIFLGLVTSTSNPSLAVTYMTCALALGAFTQSGVYSNHQDIGPQYAGILLGISNTAAAIPGIVGVALTGYILDQTSSWSLVFAIAIGFYVFGTVVYNALASGERVFH